jgi:hypothetical protein
MPSTKLAMVEELTVNFSSSRMKVYEWLFFRWATKSRQFCSVRVLQVNPFVREREIGLCLRQDEGDDGEIIFPEQEEVEV